MGIIIALFPFIVLPILVSNIHPKISRLLVGKYAMTLLILIAGLYYLVDTHKYSALRFPEANPFYKTLGDFLSENARYADVVISHNVEVPALPPQMISLTIKAVYKYLSVVNPHDFVKTLPDNAVLNVLRIEGQDAGFFDYPIFEANAIETKAKGSLSLSRFSRDKMMGFWILS